MAARITGAEFDERVLRSERPVLVDFYSDSCIPCKMLSPVLSQIETENEGRLDVYKVNIAYEEALTDKYEVQAAPTLIFFKDGSELSRIRGKTGADDIRAELEKII